MTKVDAATVWSSKTRNSMPDTGRFLGESDRLSTICRPAGRHRDRVVGQVAGIDRMVHDRPALDHVIAGTAVTRSLPPPPSTLSLPAPRR